jgi:hypothetical protein
MSNARVTRRALGRMVVATGTGALAGGTVLATPGRAATPSWVTTGGAVSALKSFDDEMKTFMQARNISAGQLAVSPTRADWCWPAARSVTGA